MLQVLAERNDVAIGLFDAAIAAEDFKSGSEASENSVRADHTFLGEAGHPFVNSARKLGEDITPITDFTVTIGSVGILAGAAHKMHR